MRLSDEDVKHWLADGVDELRFEGSVIGTVTVVIDAWILAALCREVLAARKMRDAEIAADEGSHLLYPGNDEGRVLTAALLDTTEAYDKARDGS